MRINSAPVLHTENGFRTARAEDTLDGVERLVESGFFTDILRLTHEGSGLPYFVSWFIDPTDGNTCEHHPGKGVSESQSKVSAALEGVERYCSKVHGNEVIVKASYRDLMPDAVDPTLFVLPTDTTHHETLSQEWVWGWSLTRGKEMLVPASLIFCPYDTEPQERRICDYSSNGLAAGNCIEEAILQGLLEVVERDAWMIMEYNRLAMPDLVMSEGAPDTVQHIVQHLASRSISVTVKNLTTDIPVCTFGVLLEGEHSGKRGYAFTPGTHLSPTVALTRSITEAIQLYPRYADTSSWLKSSPIEHLRAAGPRRDVFESFAEPSFDDIGSCVQDCVDLLEDSGSEVIVVDLSRDETLFPVVRVLCTQLQPIINRTNPRFSRRLSRVPVKLGYRDHELPSGEFKPRDMCGIQ